MLEKKVLIAANLKDIYSWENKDMFDFEILMLMDYFFLPSNKFFEFWMNICASILNSSALEI